MPLSIRSLACLLLLFVGATDAVAAQEYNLRSGDRLEINFYTASGAEIPEITGERVVDRNGNIFLPYVGTVSVTNLDATGVRDRLLELYSVYYDNPVVDVQAFLRVSVTGSVLRPGNYFVDPSSTLLDALATAGGATPDVTISNINIPSDPSQVRLVRDGSTSILDLRADVVDREVVDTRVQSGDWLFVPVKESSRWRDNLLFLGSILSVATSIAFLITLSN